MAVIKMKRITIAGTMNSLEKTAAVCCLSEVFQPDEVSRFEDTQKFSPLGGNNHYDEWLSELEESLSLIGKKVAVAEKHKVSQIEMDDKKAEEYIDFVCGKINCLHKKQIMLKKNIAECEEEIRNLSHFIGKGVQMDKIRQCEYIKVRFGSLPRESYKLLRQEYKEHPYITFFRCTDDEKYVWGFYFCPVHEALEIDRVFSRLYFNRLRLREMKDTPGEMIKLLQSEIERDKTELEKCDNYAQELWQKEQVGCEQIYSWLTEQRAFQILKSYVMRYNDSFILTGWVPSNHEKTLTKQLDEIAGIEHSVMGGKLEREHSPPVMIKNGFFSKPFEFFTKMYGLPNYNESDPTRLMAFLFTVMFGIMFADLGQGICIALIGYFLMWKKKHMEIGKVLVPCGISGAIFGLLFGSVFGFEELLNPLYHAIGFADKPIHVLDSGTVMNIIIASMAIGFLSLSSAMVVNIITSFRRKNLERALFSENGIAGFVFYWALVLGVVAQLVFNIEIFTLPYIIGLIILPLACIFFKEILGKLVERKSAKPEKIGEYLIQSFFEFFEVLLSLLSNTVSFLRIGAFVLVHSGMMLMIMSLADMMGPPGSVGYIIMVIFGNIFVSVLETLLVCIHVLRLQYYEMFSRFYSGDGRPFSPIKIAYKENSKA